jgi:hypothetical protein
MTAGLSEHLGQTYHQARRADPRIADQLAAAIGDPQSVVNVGAGTGSYEPTGCHVVAVEPAAAMRAQRPRQPPRVSPPAPKHSRSMTPASTWQWASTPISAGQIELEGSPR